MKIHTLLIAFLLLGMISCKKKSVVETVTNSNSCNDTTNISYSNQIQPILNYYCVQCHDASTSQNFTTYKTTKPFATAGILQGCIDGDPNFILMPPANSKKMTSCDINKIHAWVRQGMKDN
jgi:uncharacterized membrane protein